MRISYNPLHQNWKGQRPAAQFIQEEMAMLDLVEELGFDIVLPPEHHFDQNYSACPSNFLTLAYLAGRTEKLLLGLGAIIVPWNDPLRMVEQVAQLDHMSGGRLRVGYGRGLARMEFEHFALDMERSRAMMAEGFEIIQNGIRTGVVESDGEFWKHPRTPIHPIPRPEIADEILMVGMSPDSAVLAGEQGAQLLCFITKPLDEFMPLVEGYRKAFRESQNGAAPPPEVTTDFVYVHEDEDVVRENAREYVGNYFSSVLDHYEFDGTHFKDTKGYEQYQEGATAIRDAGPDAATEGYIASQAGVGTPAQVIENYRRRMEVMGPIDPAACFFYGGMTKDEAERNVRLFSEAVMPELRKMAEEFAGTHGTGAGDGEWHNAWFTRDKEEEGATA